jgi:hypothetical protein
MIGAQPFQHSERMRAIAPDVTCAWPHDGHTRDKGSGEQLINHYRRHGIKTLPVHATFPDGSNSLEAGIMEIAERAADHRLKVREDLAEWFEEYRMYHRDERGNVVSQMDDLLAATRYALMMKRYAKPAQLGVPKKWTKLYGPQPREQGPRMATGVDFNPWTGEPA